MDRVWLVGNAGSGKTTTARLIAVRMGATAVELDGIFHQPGWQPLEVTVFRATVAKIVAGDRWVVDGNYSAVADLISARADTVIWIDLPRRTVMRQLLPRTLGRLIRREELWNGNRESWRGLVRLDPEHSILRWGWTQHAGYTERYTALAAETEGTDARFVRLRSRREVDDFVRALG